MTFVPCSLTCASRWRLLQAQQEAVTIRPADQVEFPGSVGQVAWNGKGWQDWNPLLCVVLLTLAVNH